MKQRPNRPSPRARPKEAPRRGPAPAAPLRREAEARSDRRSRGPAASGPSGPRRGPGPLVEPDRSAEHVAPVEVLAEATAAIGLEVERAVFEDGKRADRVLASVLRRRRDLAAPDHRLISQAVFALFRWRGWIEPLGPRPIESRLLLSTLLDGPTIPPLARVWARVIGRDPSKLTALGNAPNWTAKSEGFRRLLSGQAVTADPWRLFPPWMREHVPLPPGDGPPKLRYVALLWALQARPSLWVRAQTDNPEALWDELRRLGVKPWLHRRLTHAARLEADVDVYHLPPFIRGALEVQDLASQAVALACDPDPGERWWDACAGAGGKALHLSALMNGKGLVVATDQKEFKLKETVRRARRSPYRNLTTKLWDGRHVAGKPGSFDGVLVDAPCSGLGTWRRNPDARWLIDREAIPRLATLQAQLLSAASAGVRPGGALVYSVCTITPSETTNVVRGFLDAHPTFRLDPFPHPLTGAETDGTLTLWPQEADSDAMFIARMIRTS